jgi:AraC-like DNA-binding protein
MTLPSKLTINDHALIEQLREQRELHQEQARECERQKQEHKRIARNLSDSKIAEKFGVSRNYLTRLFAAEKE